MSVHPPRFPISRLRKRYAPQIYTQFLLSPNFFTIFLQKFRINLKNRLLNRQKKVCQKFTASSTVGKNTQEPICRHCANKNGYNVRNCIKSQCKMYISRDAACRVCVTVHIIRLLGAAWTDASGSVPTDSDLLIQPLHTRMAS